MNKHLMWMACAAVLATTSCDKSEITESATPQTIRFDGHANKVSKALNAPVERDNFAVFGHYKDATNGKDGEVFTNDKVEYSEKSKWTYSTQNGVTVDSNSVTWTPSWGYIFAAYSPHKTNSTVTFNEDSTVVYNLGEITLTQAQQADWMTSDPEIVSAGSTKGVVRFIFNHISSRLTFKFRLDSQNPQEPQWETKTKITIKKIELLGVSSTNTYNNNEWGKEKEGFTDFIYEIENNPLILRKHYLNNEEGGDLLIQEFSTNIYVVPQVVQAKLVIEGEIEHLDYDQDRNNMSSKEFTATAFLNIDPTLKAWKGNTAYTYTLNLPHSLWKDASNITFGVTNVKSWGMPEDSSMNMNK